MKCTYCRKEIRGEVMASGWEGEMVYFDGEQERVVAPERDIGFCSDVCAWRYGIERHKAMGMSGKDARQHLIDEHGLKPA